MNQIIHEQLTIADIRALAASIYEPERRIWSGDRWRCPQCMTQNFQRSSQCACGISRDGLPEFCDRC